MWSHFLIYSTTFLVLVSAGNEFLEGFQCDEALKKMAEEELQPGDAIKMACTSENLRLSLKADGLNSSYRLQLIYSGFTGMPSVQVNDTPGAVSLAENLITDVSAQIIDLTGNDLTLDDDVACGKHALMAVLSMDDIAIDFSTILFKVQCNDPENLDLALSISPNSGLDFNKELIPETEPNPFTQIGVSSVKVISNEGTFARRSFMSKPDVYAAVFVSTELDWFSLSESAELRDNMAKEIGKMSVEETLKKLGITRFLHDGSLFKEEDRVDGVLREIDGNGLEIDLTETELPFLKAQDTQYNCDKAFMVVFLDPFQEIEDSNRENNVILLPITKRCDDSNEEWMSECRVIPDYGSLGQNSILYSTDSLLQYMWFKYSGRHNGFSMMYDEEKLSHANLLDNLAAIHSEDLEDNCELIPHLMQRLYSKNVGILPLINDAMKSVVSDLQSVNGGEFSTENNQAVMLMEAISETIDVLREDKELSSMFFTFLMKIHHGKPGGMRGRYPPGGIRMGMHKMGPRGYPDHIVFEEDDFDEDDFDEDDFDEDDFDGEEFDDENEIDGSGNGPRPRQDGNNRRRNGQGGNNRRRNRQGGNNRRGNGQGGNNRQRNGQGGNNRQRNGQGGNNRRGTGQGGNNRRRNGQGGNGGRRNGPRGSGGRGSGPGGPMNGGDGNMDDAFSDVFNGFFNGTSMMGPSELGGNPMMGSFKQEMPMKSGRQILAFIASMMLEGDDERRGKKPCLMSMLGNCIRDELWAPDEEPNGKLCSMLPESTKTKFVDVLKGMIKQESFTLPVNQSLGMNFSRAMEGIKANFTPAFSLPLERSHLEKLRTDMVAALDKIIGNIASTDSDEKAAYTLKKLFLEQMSEGTLDKMVAVMQTIQRVEKLEGGDAIMNYGGWVGDEPTAEEYCKLSVGHFIQKMVEKGKGGMEMMSEDKMDKMLPSIWRVEEDKVIKGDYSWLTNSWNWRKVAKCSCDMNQCPVYGNWGPGSDGNWGPGSDGNWGPGSDGNWGPGSDGNWGPGSDGNWGPGSDGNWGPGSDGNWGTGSDGNYWGQGSDSGWGYGPDGGWESGSGDILIDPAIEPEKK